MSRLALISFHGCPLESHGNLPTGGMQTYIRYQAKELSQLGLPVDIYTTCHDTSVAEISDMYSSVKLIHVPAVSSISDAKQALDLDEAFASNIEDFRVNCGISYSLIHSHYWSSGIVGMKLSSMWNVPHVTTFHTLGQAKLRTSPLTSGINKRIQAESKVAVSADIIVASSKDELSLLTCLSKSLAKKIHIIPPGVDTKIFMPKPEDNTLPKLQISGKKLLLFVGRLDPIKGLDTLIRALAIAENRDDVHLIIAGGELPNGQLGQSLLSLARDLDIDHLITILGPIDHEVLPNYYNAADILMLPSYHESFGLAALEAMSCGTPVVAARVGGLRYLVNDGQTGYLVSRHCPQSYAMYIDYLLSSDHLRRSLGYAARKHAEQFSWDSLARQLLKLYNRLTETSKNSGQEIGR